jgi:hypothetical protein
MRLTIYLLTAVLALFYMSAATVLADPGNNSNRTPAQEKAEQQQLGGNAEKIPTQSLAGGNPHLPAAVETTYRMHYGGAQQSLAIISGDVNLNGIPNEVGDAVLFSRYFIYGIQSFTIDMEPQVLSTDVNGDGQTLTVGDLVQLISAID